MSAGPKTETMPENCVGTELSIERYQTIVMFDAADFQMECLTPFPHQIKAFRTLHSLPPETLSKPSMLHLPGSHLQL